MIYEIFDEFNVYKIETNCEEDILHDIVSKYFDVFDNLTLIGLIDTLKELGYKASDVTSFKCV